MDATTPDEGSESTSEVATEEVSQPIEGTANAAQGSDESPSGSYDEDLSDVPEEHRQWFQEQGDKRYQRWLTKHSQGKGAEYTAPGQ